MLSFQISAQQISKSTTISDLERILEDKKASDSLRKEACYELIIRDVNQPDTVIAQRYIRLARFYGKLNDRNSAIAHCDTALKELSALEFKWEKELEKEKANQLKLVGKKDEALKVYLQVLADYEDAGSFGKSAELNMTIGILFKKINEFENAIYHLNEGIDQAKFAGAHNIQASALMTLGNCYKSLMEFEDAEKCYQASIDLCKEHQFKKTLAGNYNNLGSLNRMMKKYRESMTYYEKAVVINKEMNNRQWLSYNYNNMGAVYNHLKDYPNALKYLQMSMQMKEETNDQRGRIQTLRNIADTYRNLGDYPKAYKCLLEHAVKKDSLALLDRAEATRELAAQFQAEKREATINQLNTQDELNQEKLKARDERIHYQNFLGWLMGIGIALVLAIAIVLWVSANNRKRTNEELALKNQQIRSKNQLLDHQHNEIRSSINYAKRIQGTILPSSSKMNAFLPNYSLLYLPKDIVSGDFYLFEEVESGAFFGVADCTGHGVPGAMVSLVGSAYFEKAVKELSYSSPNEVLDYLNQEIPRAFESSDEMINDGMDIGLCHVNKEKTKLTFSGAHRSCWILNTHEKMISRAHREGLDQLFVSEKSDTALLSLKGNRQGIGVGTVRKPFDAVSVDLQPGDRVVLFTDGYVDQFGGPNDKKYKNSQLRNFLLEYQDASAEVLMQLLDKELAEWRGEQGQIDDVCVLITDF